MIPSDSRLTSESCVCHMCAEASEFMIIGIKCVQDGKKVVNVRLCIRSNDTNATDCPDIFSKVNEFGEFERASERHNAYTDKELIAR